MITGNSPMHIFSLVHHADPREFSFNIANDCILKFFLRNAACNLWVWL